MQSPAEYNGAKVKIFRKDMFVEKSRSRMIASHILQTYQTPRKKTRQTLAEKIKKNRCRIIADRHFPHKEDATAAFDLIFLPVPKVVDVRPGCDVTKSWIVGLHQKSQAPQSPLPLPCSNTR